MGIPIKLELLLTLVLGSLIKHEFPDPDCRGDFRIRIQLVAGLEVRTPM